ncbi:MAG: HAMP domain-containing histidine kinase [Candidatus Riflebacteria bacterium]|nr:HAMP domain-containing histidine kinase [Candidatus Riflebacteria bacterium]
MNPDPRRNDPQIDPATLEEVEVLREALLDLERANIKEREARAEADAILAGLNVLSDPGTRGRVVEKLIEVLRSIIPFEEAFILTPGSDGLLHPTICTAETLMAATWPVGNMLRRVLAGKATACFDVAAVPEWRTQPESVRRACASALHVLLRQQPTPAVLVCLHSRRGFFSATHVRRAMRLAPLVAQALFNIEYTHQAEEMAEELHRQTQALQQEMVERRKTARQLEESLRRSEEQKQRLLESSESNSALVSLLTHDVANPLTGLLAVIALLQRKLRGEYGEYLQKMEACANDIQAIIKNVRLLRATANGKVSLRLSAVNLIETLDRTIESLAGSLQVKQVEVVKSWAGAAPSPALWVEAEPVSLQFSVLQNVLANAVKFSHPGSRIAVDLQTGEAQVVVAIRDQGIGIPDALLPHLFETNRETTRPGTRGERGTGFGLPLVRMFVERYGGSIVITSHNDGPNTGTQVLLSLPRAAAPEKVEPIPG